MTQETSIDALQARLIRSMPTMAELCTSDDPSMFRSLLSRIGDKWTLLVIGVLGEERRRFTELSEIIPGISRRMLTVTLRALERDGLVSRTVYAEVPHIPFPESGLAPASFMYAFVGVEAEPDALVITPNLPSTLTRVGVRNLHCVARGSNCSSRATRSR